MNNSPPKWATCWWTAAITPWLVSLSSPGAVHSGSSVWRAGGVNVAVAPSRWREAGCPEQHWKALWLRCYFVSSTSSPRGIKKTLSPRHFWLQEVTDCLKWSQSRLSKALGLSLCNKKIFFFFLHNPRSGRKLVSNVKKQKIWMLRQYFLSWKMVAHLLTELMQNTQQKSQGKAKQHSEWNNSDVLFTWVTFAHIVCRNKQ